MDRSLEFSQRIFNDSKTNFIYQVEAKFFSSYSVVCELKEPGHKTVNAECGSTQFISGVAKAESDTFPQCSS